VNRDLDQVFYSYAENQWHYNDLTSSAGAPVATSASGLTSVLLPDGPHIAYVDWNQHVDQVFYSFSQNAWYCNDLTATTHTAPASPGTALSSFTFSGDPHIVYVDANQHVEQIFYAFSVDQWFYNDLTSETGSPLASSAVPTASLTNLTHPNLTPNFAVGDTFQVTIDGAPNQAVNLTQTANGTTGSSYMGNTDAYGNFTTTGVEQTGNIGSYTQVWSVGGVQAGSAFSFVVGQFGTTGTVTTTDAGQTSDGHMEGVSSLSITNGVVSTYSATVLDYTASLYYDSDTVATLFDEGARIGQATTAVNVSTAASLSANAIAWHDYDLQTDHYTIAYFLSGSYYENPFYWGSSCYADTGDCSVNNSGGYAYWITAASIYMGSTLADQTNVPQDGSLPAFSDQSVWGILPSGQTPPSGPQWNLQRWEAILLATAPALELAEGMYAKTGQIYPLPMFLDLINETQIAWVQGVSLPSRTRTYVLKDTTGHAWDNSRPPITIFEKFIYVFGTGGMPDANNPDFNGAGWNRSNRDLRPDGSMDDEIGVHFPQPEVDYLQLFWATGLNAPGLVLPSAIPGFGLPPLKSDPLSPQIPLFIRDHRSKCKQGDFSVQGIELNSQFVGINGDTGVGTPCRNN
jgi:hypothetical protein